MEILYKRDIFDAILTHMDGPEVIVLHGARQVGKTSTLRYLQRHLSESGEAVYYIDLEDSRIVHVLDGGIDEFLMYLEGEGTGMRTLAHGKRLHILIDEIQYLANPSSFLKLIADHHPQLKLVVSGSSSFNIKTKFKDSLVGRTVEFELYPLSFGEFLRFKQYAYEREKAITAKKAGELVELYREYALFGGYPRIVLTLERAKKETRLQQIVDTYIKKDIRDLARIKDIGKFNRLLEMLASQSGQLLNVTEAANTLGMGKRTLEQYLFLLEQTYVIALLRPFSRNMRSEITKMPKIFFYDTGLMHLLWLKQLPRELLGQTFETSVFAELVKRYGLNAVFHWRTTDKKEIDFIVRQGSRLLPMEVKLNFSGFKPSAVSYFSEKYRTKAFKVVGLYGQKRDASFVYPWEL